MIDPTKVVADWEQDYKLMQDQRAEIARLRLTDAEREAVEFAVEHLQNSGWGTAVLRGLLDRLG